MCSTDRYASEAGAEVLEVGGNAVDAAVATAFALAVVNPEAGNVGGGGFLVLRTPEGELAALDFRSTAPAAATGDLFADDVRGTRSLVGHLAAAVPGSVAGLAEAHRRFGRLPWSDLVEPAVALARGFTVTPRFLASYEPHIVEGLAGFAESARVFLPGGRPPEEGSTIRQDDLATTLERIRDHGPDGFYRGETAEGLVAEMERGGGLITLEDLAAYRAVWREPLRLGYRGRAVVSMPPSSSGGVTLALIARLLERVDVGALAWHGARHVHVLVEAWKRAYADRNHYLADPDAVAMPLDTLVSGGYAGWRGRSFPPERATPAVEVGPGVEAFRDGSHTTHVSVVDADGGAVSLTTTLNTWYGSKLVARGTGVLLNNEMDDFSVRPGQANYFGLVQGEANAVRPGMRPLSAMTPTLVLDGRGGLELVLGTPGGGTIITTVWQILSNVVDHGMDPVAATLAPRVHHQHLPDVVKVEPGGLPPAVIEALTERGHEVEERDEWSGDAQTVQVLPGGRVRGVADPRRGGAAAYPSSGRTG